MVLRAKEVIHSGNAVDGNPVRRELRDANAPTEVREVYYDAFHKLIYAI